MAKRASITVHIVEDDDSVREALAIVVSGEGLEVMAWPDGASFLSRAQPLGCDIVLLDLDLPDMRGTDVAARLNALENSPRIAVISGLKGMAYERAVASIEPWISFRKPIDVTALISSLAGDRQAP